MTNTTRSSDVLCIRCVRTLCFSFISLVFARRTPSLFIKHFAQLLSFPFRSLTACSLKTFPSGLCGVSPSNMYPNMSLRYPQPHIPCSSAVSELPTSVPKLYEYLMDKQYGRSAARNTQYVMWQIEKKQIWFAPNFCDMIRAGEKSRSRVRYNKRRRTKHIHSPGWLDCLTREDLFDARSMER